MEIKILEQLAQNGLLGLLLAMAIGAIVWQRREINGLWERIVSGAKQLAELAASTQTTLQALTVSTDSRARSIEAVAEASKQTAEAVKSLSFEVAAIKRLAEDGTRTLADLIEKTNRCRQDMDAVIRDSQDAARQINDLARRFESREGRR